MVDLNQKVILPGFIDPHIHMCFSSMTHWTELSSFLYKDMEEVYDKIIETVNGTKEGEWALFQLYDPMITAGFSDVSIKGLNKISSTKPIFIM
jgi:predicted amidohydrolase YtcJ